MSREEIFPPDGGLQDCMTIPKLHNRITAKLQNFLYRLPTTDYLEPVSSHLQNNPPGPASVSG
jgi:hypothetical protein